MLFVSADICGGGRLRDEPKEHLRRRLPTHWYAKKSNEYNSQCDFSFGINYCLLVARQFICSLIRCLCYDRNENININIVLLTDHEIFNPISNNFFHYDRQTCIISFDEIKCNVLRQWVNKLLASWDFT